MIDSSPDWATRAALWAQQRQAQEDMAKQPQGFYPPPPNQQPKPPLPNTDGTARDPPPPPGEKQEHNVDNLETVAMDDEPLDSGPPDQGIAVTRLDYNHGQPVPLPEVGPPPALPGILTTYCSIIVFTIWPGIHNIDFILAILNV